MPTARSVIKRRPYRSHAGTPLHTPPPSWRRKVKDPVERLEQWKAATQLQRRGAWYMARRVSNLVQTMTARLQENPEDLRARSYLEKRRKIAAYRQAPIVSPSKVIFESVKSSCSRYTLNGSRELLDFKRKHVLGCTVDGCVMGPGLMEPIMCLFQHDHVVRETKKHSVTCLRGAAREKELKKTQVLCVWHHWLKTHHERNEYHAAVRRHHPHRELGLYKMRVGCQHPLHASMPYASMVPSAEQERSVVGFLHVSHLTLTTTNQERLEIGDPHSLKLADLKTGAAAVHCDFCHKLYTLCEQSKQMDAPYTKHEFAKLVRRYPAFVQHFDETTAGHDWMVRRKFRKPKRAESFFDEEAYIAADVEHVITKARRAKASRVIVPQRARR